MAPVRLLAGVNLEVLLEVEAPAVELAAEGAALVLSPVVVHVPVEVIHGVEGEGEEVALDAVHWPVVVVPHLVLLFSLLTLSAFGLGILLLGQSIYDIRVE